MIKVNKEEEIKKAMIESDSASLFSNQKINRSHSSSEIPPLEFKTVMILPKKSPKLKIGIIHYCYLIDLTESIMSLKTIKKLNHSSTK